MVGEEYERNHPAGQGAQRGVVRDLQKRRPKQVAPGEVNDDGNGA